MNLMKTVTVETVTEEIGKSPLGYIKGLMAQGSRLSYALCIAVQLYVGKAKDKTAKKERMTAVSDILAAYGQGSMAYTLLNIGALVVKFNLSSADIDKRTRLLKEHMRDLQSSVDKEDLLGKVEAIEDKARKDAEKARQDAKKALTAGDGDGDKEDGDNGDGDNSKEKPAKSPATAKQISAQDALSFLTVAGKERMVFLFKAFGSRPGDESFKAESFIDFLINSAMGNISAASKASKAQKSA